MRVALVTTSYPRRAGDAAGHFVETEARALAEAGHVVRVFAAGKGEASHGDLEVIWLADGGASGFPGIAARLRSAPWRSLGVAAWLLRVRRELLRRGPFERIVLHWLVPNALPLLLSIDTAAELEVVVHGSDARLLARLPRPFARALLNRLLLRRLRFRCVSNELGELLEAVAGRSLGDRVEVEPAALELDATQFDRARERQRLGVDAHARLAVVVARLIPEKRIEAALRAASLVSDLDVTVVGDGPLRAALASSFPRVRFTGQLTRPEALSWIAAADVLLSASRNEGAPTAVREARALGVPVVACDCGDLRRWAQDDPGLFLVD